ncbi:DUF2703 domain-containing protein [Lutispora thermophila]|uniref:Uncharacterized protein n=1 Tax=Lutispora thermophila DSM 19022 TaxID=1122184 RepID=A0A1M6GV33_9FIRM|nr:DUF2703 domain-containing protein [Lutispora thermophila]SHJ13816.1 protein of unknown function [Lutispora thermophila DSM 19022]
MNNSKHGCNSCGCGYCCSGFCRAENIEIETRQVVVDFLYVNHGACELCQETEKNLEEAINSISNVLELADIEVVINKINVDTEELAIKYKFSASSAIRVDGRNIKMELREMPCSSKKEGLHCWVWPYKGKEYIVPPATLIAEGLLRSIFGHEYEINEDNEYIIPENLKKFMQL